MVGSSALRRSAIVEPSPTPPKRISLSAVHTHVRDAAATDRLRQRDDESIASDRIVPRRISTGPTSRALALTDDEILDAVEAGLAAQGRGETVIEPRMHLMPGSRVQRPLQRAARLRRAARARRRQGRRRLRRQLPARPAVGDGPAEPVRSGDRPAGRDHRRCGAHRHAHRRRHRDRRQAPRAQGEPDPRAHRRARHRLLERAPARSAVRLRRDPRAFAPAGEPRRASPQRLSRDLGKPVIATDDWEILRARRRHRRRGVAARSSPSRCSRPDGSSAARSSCPTAR